MREINIKVYSIYELNEDAKEKALNKYRDVAMESEMDAVNADFRNTLERFENLTGTICGRWEVDASNYSFDTRFKNDELFYEGDKLDDDIFLEDLKGKLLRRYLTNNIIPYILRRKVYMIFDNGVWKWRRSEILYDNDVCPLTGMYMDLDILGPLLDWYRGDYRHERDLTLAGLYRRCYDSFFRSWQHSYVYYPSDDMIMEWMDANGFMFHENGMRYEG